MRGVQLFAGFSAFVLSTHPGNLAAAPATLTSNLEAAPVFRPFLDKMWQSSPTFRDQCRRLGAETGLRVSVLLEDRPGRSLFFHARTVLGRKDGSLVTAQVYLKPDLEAAELIAHELEHILEQLDGVDLKAQAGNGIVWKSGDDTFETRRAIEAGRRVAREVTGSGANGLRNGPDETATSRVATVAQRDRDAAPTSAFSSRERERSSHCVRLVGSTGRCRSQSTAGRVSARSRNRPVHARERCARWSIRQRRERQPGHQQRWTIRGV